MTQSRNRRSAISRTAVARIMENAFAHFRRRIDIPEIDDNWLEQGAVDAFKVEGAEGVPLGHDYQRRGAFRACIRALAKCHFRQQWMRLVRGLRIIDVDSSARPPQHSDNIERQLRRLFQEAARPTARPNGTGIRPSLASRARIPRRRFAAIAPIWKSTRRGAFGRICSRCPRHQKRSRLSSRSKRKLALRRYARFIASFA
jgi:hypothetical protein